MKLTKFQQHIKDEEIEADKNEIQSIIFINEIKETFSDQYELLMDDIQNSMDFRTHIERALSCETYASTVEIGNQIKLRVNELINVTQEEIEDIRIYNMPDDSVCDIESFKRDRELNQ